MLNKRQATIGPLQSLLDASGPPRKRPKVARRHVRATEQPRAAPPCEEAARPGNGGLAA